MTGILRKIISQAVLAAALTATAVAQPAKPIANWANLNQLVPGSEIRVTLASGRSLRGFVQGATTDALVINASTSQEALSRQEIRRVSLKRPGHRGRNTLIGLAVGAGVGVASGAVEVSRTRPGAMFRNLGYAVFPPLGALVGTAIGVALPTGGWRDVYRAP